jgi:hypothetical protein
VDDEHPIERDTSQLIGSTHGLSRSFESTRQRLVTGDERGAEAAHGYSVGRQLRAPRPELIDDISD